MQRRKSRRHVRAANARWSKPQRREREPRDPIMDARLPIVIDLRSWGGRLLRIDPEPGLIKGRMSDGEFGDEIAVAALKTLLHSAADALPRMIGWRRLG